MHSILWITEENLEFVFILPSLTMSSFINHFTVKLWPWRGNDLFNSVNFTLRIQKMYLCRRPARLTMGSRYVCSSEGRTFLPMCSQIWRFTREYEVNTPVCPSPGMKSPLLSHLSITSWLGHSYLDAKIAIQKIRILVCPSRLSNTSSWYPKGQNR